MIVLVHCFLWLVTTTIAENGGETRHVRIPIETFQFEKSFFTFYAQRANWDEATAICQATDSRLVMVSNASRAVFLAQTLMDTQMAFTDVWVGGRFMNDYWTWALTGEKFSLNTNSNSIGFPPWIQYPTQRGKHCLTLTRKGHDSPMFVEQHCRAQKSFICEKEVIRTIFNYPQKSITAKYRGIKYTTYHARVTWDEALAFCRQAGAMLATIADFDVAYFLIGIMRRSRPEVETLWVGAKFMFSEWVWLSNNTGFPTAKQPNGFPPWVFNESRGESKMECMFLDRHPCQNHNRMLYRPARVTCEDPVFINSKCDKRKDFLCEEVPMAPPPKTYSTVYMGVNYTFVLVKKSWEEAYEDCRERKMKLVAVETFEELNYIVTMMSEISDSWIHTWLGGVFKPEVGRWIWNSTNTVIPNELIKPNNEKNKISSSNKNWLRDEDNSKMKKFPPWCVNKQTFENEVSCLNLDRADFAMSVWYGLGCETRQGFVCEVRNKKEVTVNRFAPSKNVLYNEKKDFRHAVSSCSSKKLTLITVNTMDKARALALELPEDQEVWVGARRENGHWRWISNHEKIAFFANREGYPPWENLYTNVGSQCLAMTVGLLNWPIFRERSCNSRLSYMCEKANESYPQPSFSLQNSDIYYAFYMIKVTWEEAVEICAISDQYLVQILTVDQARLITTAMDNNYTPLWLAGRFVGNSWEWVVTGDDIETGPQKVGNEFAPWPPGVSPEQMGAKGPCLVFEKSGKHKSHNLPYFFGRRCSKKYGFVCTTNIESPEMVYEKLVVLDDKRYMIIAKDYNYQASKALCNEKNGEISSINDLQIAEQLFYKTDVLSEFWVDGFKDNNGIWRMRPTNSTLAKNIPFIPDKYNGKCLSLAIKKKTNKVFFKATQCLGIEKVVCSLDNDVSQSEEQLPDYDTIDLNNNPLEPRMEKQGEVTTQISEINRLSSDHKAPMNATMETEHTPMITNNEKATENLTKTTKSILTTTEKTNKHKQSLGNLTETIRSISTTTKSTTNNKPLENVTIATESMSTTTVSTTNKKPMENLTTATENMSTTTVNTTNKKPMENLTTATENMSTTTVSTTNKKPMENLTTATENMSTTTVNTTDKKPMENLTTATENMSTTTVNTTDKKPMENLTTATENMSTTTVNTTDKKPMENLTTATENMSTTTVSTTNKKPMENLIITKNMSTTGKGITNEKSPENLTKITQNILSTTMITSKKSTEFTANKETSTQLLSTTSVTSIVKIPNRKFIHDKENQIKIFVEPPATWTSASENCKKLGAKLATNYLENQKGRALFRDVEKEFGNIWFGIQQQGKKWVYKNNDVEKVNFKKLPPWKDRAIYPKAAGKPKLCLLTDRSRPDGLRLDAKPCNTSLSYICIEDIRPCSTLKDSITMTWSPKECTSGKNVTKGTVCRANCATRSKILTLMGPERITCRNSEWFSRKSSSVKPRCLVEREKIQEFVSSVKEIFRPLNTHMLFVVDISDDRKSKQEHRTIVFFAEVFVMVFPLINGSRHASLVTLAKTSRDVLADEISSCYMLQSMLDEKKKAPEHGSKGINRDFSHALLMAERIFGTRSAGKKNKILVFITSGPDDGSLKRVEIAERLKKSGVTILAVGVNNYDRNQLEEMASVGPNNRMLLYGYKNVEFLRDAGTALQSLNKFLTTISQCK